MIYNFKKVSNGWSVYENGVLTGTYTGYDVQCLPIQDGIQINVQDGNNTYYILSLLEDTININGVTQTGTQEEIIEKLISDVFSTSDGGSGSSSWNDIADKPTGTDRQVVGFNVDGDMTPVTLGWKQFSDQPEPPESPVNALVYNSGLPEGNQFGFGALSETAEPFSIPLRDDEGKLTIVPGTDTNHAISVGQLDIRVPTPPASGNYILKSVDGVVSWVAEV